MKKQDSLYEKRNKLSVSWYCKASNLRGAAGALWACMDLKRSKEVVETLDLASSYRMDVATTPVYRMLCGMALELLFKAITVGKGNKPNTKSHNLNKLAADAGIDISEYEVGLLDILSEYIIWTGRYPVPNKAEDLDRLLQLGTEHLYNKEPMGNTRVLKPNGALSWKSFNVLWNKAEPLYWRHHTDGS